MLDNLLADDLAALALSCGTAEALANALRAQPVVVAIRRAGESGNLDAAAIEAFVQRLLQRFTPGRRFFGDGALAALAVALERDYSQTAERFLKELSALKIAEIPMAGRVARLVCVGRTIGTTDATFQVTPRLRAVWIAEAPPQRRIEVQDTEVSEQLLVA